jgi:hypothetical protein
MTHLLLTVNDRHVAKDGGLVLLPSIAYQAGDGCRAGDPISLWRPKVPALEWRIARVTADESSKGHFLVLEGLRRRDVPVGTTVRSLPRPEPPRPFPRRAFVRVTDPGAEGLAVRLWFEMVDKNDYPYTVFLGPGGFAEVSAEDLLRDFDHQASFAIMDYTNPRGGFSGRVTASILTNEELRRGMEGVEKYRKFYTLPEGCEEKLRAAAARGQNPDDYELELHVE